MNFINPKTDFAFKKIFGSADSKDILISFLNAIIYEEHPVIEDLEILDPYSAPQLKGMRNSYLDVKAIINGAITITIEMQVLNVEGFEKRVLYNATKAYSLPIESGKSYDLSTPLIALTIADFQIFDHLETMISRFSVKEKNDRIDPLADELEFVFVELPKLDKTLGELETLTDKWIYFITTAQIFRSVPEELGNVPEIRKAFEIANQENLDAEELADLGRREMFIQDQHGAINIATRIGTEKGIERGFERGLKEGIERGLKQGKLELVMLLLESRFGPLSPAIKTRISRLSIEQLENLGEAILEFASMSDLTAQLQTYYL